MAEKEIALLREQIERLNDKMFDLEAWKNHTEIYLERIFGKESSILKMIQELKYDYSSWGLRDFSSTGKPNNPVVVQAKEILEAAITQLQQFGLPTVSNETTKAWLLIEEEMTGKQVKELRTILASDDKDKKEKAAKILEMLEGETLSKIIAGILLS